VQKSDKRKKPPNKISRDLLFFSMTSLPFKTRNRFDGFLRIKAPVNAFLPPRSSDVCTLNPLHQLPILQNHRINNLTTGQTFPSPELFLGAVKFVVDHDALAALTL
jgi:hypothetical protein